MLDKREGFLCILNTPKLGQEFSVQECLLRMLESSQTFTLV